MIRHTPQDLYDLAEEGFSLCLRCGEPQDPEPGEGLPQTCEWCGSPAVYPAAAVLEMTYLLEE